MSNPNELAKELLEQDGIEPRSKGSSERERIQRMIRKEGRKIRQMRWVTLALWVAAVSGMLWGPDAHDAFSELPRSSTRLYVSIFVGFLPLAAFASTILLLARSWGMSRRETNLRLASIEEQLRRLEEPPDGS